MICSKFCDIIEVGKIISTINNKSKIEVNKTFMKSSGNNFRSGKKPFSGGAGKKYGSPKPNEYKKPDKSNDFNNFNNFKGKSTGKTWEKPAWKDKKDKDPGRADRPPKRFDKPAWNKSDKPAWNKSDRPAAPKRFDKRFDKPAKKTEAAVTAPPVVEREDSGMVYGRNAVIELLKSGKTIDKLFVQSGQREGSITVIFSEAVKKSIPIIEVEKVKLDSMINNSAHQGVIALASEKEYCSIEDILKIAKNKNEKPFILIADKIMDPHNLGAIIRTAECAGVHGIIIPKRNAAGVSPIVAKTSAGASIHMAIAKVANIASAIEELKEEGVWVFAAVSEPDADGENTKDYTEAEYDVPIALVVGNEGEGLSPILIQKSDYQIKIPMLGAIESLNVSCASAVLMYEASRQRRQKQK